jgi:Tfp pilus assembly protein PilV
MCGHIPQTYDVFKTERHTPIKAGDTRKNLMSPYTTTIQAIANKVAGRFRSALSSSRGISLMETIIALAMFSTAGTAVLQGVGTAHMSSDRVNASAVAENLARNQMEYISSLPYVSAPGSYSSVADDPGLNITIPSGFAVSATAQPYRTDDGFSGSIQSVVVTVTRDGQSILVLESLRTGM